MNHYQKITVSDVAVKMKGLTRADRRREAKALIKENKKNTKTKGHQARRKV